MAGLAKLSLVIRHEAWKASGERGLTPTQSQILSVVAGSRAPIGVKAVAEQLAVNMATASEAISALVEKGLVEKRPDPNDGRVVLLRLTRSGRRQARASQPWPESLRSAASALGESEQASLLRGLIGMVRTLQEQGAVPTARMCVECRFFRANRHPGADKRHHCDFIGAPIADVDLRIDCADMQPALPIERETAWTLVTLGPSDSMRAGVEGDGLPAASQHSRSSLMATKAIFYHAGCPVCVSAERTVAEGLDRSKFDVEIVHLGQQKGRVAEAERSGVKSVPALVINGQPFHINHGADLAALKG